MDDGKARFIAVLLLCVAALLLLNQDSAAPMPAFLLPFICLLVPPLKVRRTRAREPFIRLAPDPHSGPAPFRAPPV